MKGAKTYWNSNGYLQEEYNRLTAKDAKYTKQEENVKYRYRRYFNDGDRPQGSAYYGNSEIERYLEYQVNIVVARAFMREFPEEVTSKIKYWANKQLMGFKKFIGD